MKAIFSKVIVVFSAVLMVFSSIAVPSVAALDPSFNLKVTPGCGFNMLEWDAVAGASSYWIYRGPGEGQEYSTPLTDFPVPDTKFKDEINIENGKKYCYFVRAVNDQAEEFAQSNEACATPVCGETTPPEELDLDCRLKLSYQVGNKMYKVNDVDKGPMDEAPNITQNRMFLLIRYVAIEVGAQVGYDATEKKVTLKAIDGQTLELWIGKPTAKVNGVSIQIDPNNPKVVPFILGGRTFVPMRFAAENLGATGPEDVKWFESTRTVELLFADNNCRRCICGTVEKVDCNAPNPVVTIKDENGKVWTIYITKDMCRTIKVGGCYIFCGSVRRRIQTPTTATALTPEVYFVAISIKPTECPCSKPEPDIKCICATVIRQNCDGNRPSVLVQDENGNQIILYVDASICKEMLPGTCWKVCGKYTPGSSLAANLPPSIQVVQAEKTDCPCKPQEPIKCLCVTVERQACDGNRPMVYVKDENGTMWLLYVNKELCAAMVAGSCWIVCGKVVQSTPGTTNAPNQLAVTAAKKTDCPCKPVTEEKCFCATILRVDCANGRVLAKDENGNMWFLLGVPADICAKLKPEMCVKVCGVPVNQQGTAAPEFKITKIEIVDCPCKPTTDLTKCICVKIERLDCTAAQPIAYGIDGDGIRWMLYLDAAICQKMKIGDCWKVCGTIPMLRSATSPPFIKVTTAAKVDCPCPPSEDCKWIRGEILGLRESSPVAAGKYNLIFRPCNEEKEAVLFANEDLKDASGQFILSQYKGCAEVCIKDNVVIKWKALPNEKPCCPPKPERTCLCVTVRQQHCDEDKPFILVTDENLKTWTIYLDKALCEKFKQGTCWKICGWDVTPAPTLTAATFPTFKLDTYDQVDCPCKKPEEPCFCVKIEKYDCATDPAVIYGMTPSNTLLALYVDQDACKKYQEAFPPGTCVEVCGTRVSDRGFKVTSIKKVDCPCGQEDCKWVRIEILGVQKVVLGDRTVYSATIRICGENDTIILAAEKDLIDEKANLPLSGYKGCAEVCIKDKTIVKWRALPNEKPCCPERVCICFTVEKQECNGNPPVVYGKDAKGRTWKLVVSADWCAKMRPGTCWKVCGQDVTPPATTAAPIPTMNVSTIEETKCPCKEEEPPTQNCFCFELQKFEEYQGGIYIIGIADTGAPTRLFLRKEVWEKYKDILKIGGCYIICLDPTGQGNYTIKPTNCPCRLSAECKWRRGRIVQVKWLTDNKLTVKFIDCEKPANPLDLISEDMIDVTNTFPLSQYHGCAEVCFDEKGNIVKWRALPNAKDCCKEEQKETCICLTIEKVDCSGNPPTVTGKDENGIPWVLELNRELCAKFGNYLVVGRCIRVCGIEKTIAGTTGKYLQVTTIRPTECPCKPLEENCDWIKGVVMETYTGKWVEEKHGAKIHMFFWQCVDYEGAGGRWYLAKTDLPDTSGNYLLSTYRGCAELCVKDGFIIKWRALPDDKNCCPPPTRVGRCVTIEGIDCSADPPRFWGPTTWPGEKCVVYVTREQCIQLKIGQCYWVFGLIKTPPTGFTKAIQAETLSAADPCPCPQPVNTTICIKVEKMECNPGLSYVWGTDTSGNMWILLVSQGLCNQMKPGTCWRVTGWVGAALGMREMEGISNAEQVDCSACQEQKPEIKCFCFTIAKVDCRADPPLLIGKDEDGNETILVLEKWMCERYANYLVPERCLKVCGYKVKVALGPAVDALGWKITSIEPTECPCKPQQEIKCFCVTIRKVDCAANPPRVVVVDEDGNEVILVLDEAMCKRYANFLVPEKCLKVCGYRVKIAISPNVDGLGWKVTSIDPVDCPCKQEEPVKCFCFTIQRVVCTTDPPRVYGTDENGDPAILVLTAEMCQKFKEILLPGKCIKVCGRLVKIPIAANVDGLGWKVTSLEPAPCPCEEKPIEKCFCFTLRDINCNTNPPRLIGTTESGETVVIFVDAETCKKVLELTRNNKILCFKVCGVQTTDAAGVKGWKITSIQQVDCPCGQPAGEKCMCVEVIRVACDSRTPVVYVKDQDSAVYIISVDADLCKKMQIGTCWKICGIIGDKEGNFIRFKLTSYEQVKCPCGQETKPECICVQIERVDCSASPPVVYGKQGNGRMWMIYVSADMCAKLKPGTCWKLCGKIEFPAGANIPILRVSTYDQVECPCEGSKPADDGCICFTVTEQNCNADNPYILYTDSEGRSGKLDLTVLGGKEVCEAMRPGTCWKVCRVKVVTGQITITLEQVKCPCPTP